MATKPRTHAFVCALTLPGRKDHPRFVFTTIHGRGTRRLHTIRCNKGDGSPVQQWLERLRVLGLKPECITLAKVPIDQLAARRDIWIRLLIADGRPLYNVGKEGGRRRRPTIYVKHLQHRIITERSPKPRWQRSMSTIKQNYQREIGQRKR